MSNLGKPIFSKYTVDDLFFLAFNINIGLLPPFINIIGNKALQLPLIITAVLIYIRLMARPKVLNRFIRTLRDPNIILILALIGLLIFSALTVDYAENDRIRILLKPGLILLVMTTLRYSISNHCELDQIRLGKYLLTGIIIGLVIISSLSYWNSSEWVLYLDSEFGMVRVKKLNRALEISSVLVFLSAISIANPVRSFFVTITLAAWVFILSFLVVGSAFWSGTWHPQVHVDSETVQFGMPLAFVVFILAQKFPNLAKNIVFGGIAFLLATAPWLYQLIYKFVSSQIDTTMPIGVRKILFRSEIWDIAAKKSLESPLFGFGIDSTRYLGNIVVNSTYKSVNVLIHPHNMILQIWLDLGVSGVAILFGLLIMAWRFMSKVSTRYYPSILGGLAMLAVFSIVSHSLWQTWSVSLIAIFITVVSLLRTRTNDNEAK